METSYSLEALSPDEKQSFHEGEGVYLEIMKQLGAIENPTTIEIPTSKLEQVKRHFRLIATLVDEKSFDNTTTLVGLHIVPVNDSAAMRVY